MASPFEIALTRADKTIEKKVMSAIVIDGAEYSGVFDEVPREMDAINGDNRFALSGSFKTVTLFQSCGYKPNRNDEVILMNKKYYVTGYSKSEEMIILQVE